MQVFLINFLFISIREMDLNFAMEMEAFQIFFNFKELVIVQESYLEIFMEIFAANFEFFLEVLDLLDFKSFNL